MQTIPHINGLTVEVEDNNGKRSVKYNGVRCPLIGRREVLCEQNTYYRGELLDSWETYSTPVGVVERHYWARGAGLERNGTDWRIIPVTEIAAAQKRFEDVSKELHEVRKSLELYFVKYENHT